MSTIYIQNISKQYQGRGGIQDINLEFPDGKLIAIVGPSGCGKTTLLRTIAGFLLPDKGQIKFDDRDVTMANPQDRNASMVFQQYALWPHMSVFDNIAYGLKLKKLPQTEIQQRVDQILSIVEIDNQDVKKRHPQEYSGGQQQRIALARALVVKPDVLLMDEPLSNLDAKVRQRLRLEIKRIQEEAGITTIYVTHDQEEALSMADYVVIMNQGRVEQTGSPKEVYQRPGSEFVAKFLGESHQFTMNNGVDKEITYIVRAEDIQIVSQDQAQNLNQEVWLTVQGKIVSDLYLGSTQRYMIEVNEAEIFANSEENFAPGSDCWIAINRDKLLTFSKLEENKTI